MRLGNIVRTRSGDSPAGLADGLYTVLGAGGAMGSSAEFNVGPGEILVGRVGTVGSVQLLTSPSWATDNTIVVTPTGDNCASWIAYCLRAARLGAEASAVATAQPLITSSEVRNLFVPLIAHQEQERIADFLDDRVARIDKIITARRRQVALEAEGFRSKLESVLGEGGARQPLKHLLAGVTSGPRGWGDLVADEGTPFVRITNLSALGIELKTQQLICVAAPDDAEAVRARLTVGDVLLSITAVFGEVAVWRAGPGTFSQHVARLRPLRVEDAEWIAWCLQSRAVHDQYRLSAYGGTKVGLGLEQVRNLTVPMTTSATREATARALSASWSGFEAVSVGLGKSIDLLTDYKQSLITAAITGELDVATAGSRIPG